MILLTRLKGAAFALNPDLIERADSTPDTVVTLVDGTKYVVAEPVHILVERVRDFRASVIASAHALEAGAAAPVALAVAAPVAGSEDPTVVMLHRREH